MNETPPMNKRKSGFSKSLNLQQLVLKDGKKLQERFDKEGNTWHVVSCNEKYFPCYIGVLVRLHTEPYHRSWAKVLEEQRAKIAPSMAIGNFFPLNHILYLITFYKNYIINYLLIWVQDYFDYADVSREELSFVHSGIDRFAAD